MDYSDLKKKAKKQGLQTQDISSKLDMSAVGFKYAIEQQTLPIKKVVPLCNLLKISPTDFFSSAKAYDLLQVQDTAVPYKSKQQSLQEDIQVAIKMLEWQLKEKDEQINKLIQLLNKK